MCDVSESDSLSNGVQDVLISADAYEKAIAHAQYGHKNIQDTIKFVDTKVALMFSALALVCGGFFALIDKEGVSKDTCFCTIVVIAVIAAVIAVVCGIFALSPRKPISPKIQKSCLFPFVDDDKKVDAYRCEVKGIVKGVLICVYGRNMLISCQFSGALFPKR